MDQYYKPKYFIDQAAPRFELGIKDLQSPALPLGHAAKSDLKSRKILFIHIILLIIVRRRGLLNPFFFVESLCTYPFPIPLKKFIPVFLLDPVLFSSIDCISKHTLLKYLLFLLKRERVSSHRLKNLGQIGTINYIN